MTLEETKEQVAQSESRLSQLKEDKHQLFLQLKKVLNEDDTRRKNKESSFKYNFYFKNLMVNEHQFRKLFCASSNDMMLFHAYPPGTPLVHQSTHGSTVYMPIGTSRPVFNGGKEDSIMNLQGVPPSSLYSQPINHGPTIGHQAQSNQKRSRSPSPPPQLYHSYKPTVLSPYNSSILTFHIYGNPPKNFGMCFH